MREIEARKKLKVVQLFLEGASYDEISQRVEISKGSVTNIVEEFRDGDIDIPDDMSGYIDALRVVAVDIRKSGANINRVMKCLSLYKKLEELGATDEQVSRWVDTCRDLASPAASGSEFVKAAMELVRLSHDTGCSYAELIAEYNVKTSDLKRLKQTIVQAEAQLDSIALENEKEKDKAYSQLDTIRKSIETAHETFQKQKDGLGIELDEYLTRNKLNWKKVQLAVALFDNEVGKGGLSEREREILADRLRSVLSLKNVIEQKQQEKSQLESSITVIRQEKRKEIEEVEQLKQERENLKQSLTADNKKRDDLIEEVQFLEAKSRQLDKDITDKGGNLYASHLFLDFMFAPKAINDTDLDHLVNMMIMLRQQRLGIIPKQVIDGDGTVVCQCQVPRISYYPRYEGVTLDNIRTELAEHLVPLLKDKFVSKFQFDMAVMNHEIDKLTAVTEAVLQERGRHLI